MRNSFLTDAGDLCPYISHEVFNYSTNISLQNKYVYVETPKVACSTVKVTLQKMELGVIDSGDEDSNINWHDRESSPLLQPSQISNIKTFLLRDDIYKFCFVRNPYGRLLSAYLNKIAGNKPQKRNLLLQLGYNPTDLTKEISFETFIDAVVQQPISMMNIHWRTQYYQTFQDGIEYDFIGRFETFDEHFSEVLTVLYGENKPTITNDLRHKTSANDQIREHYTQALKDKVYNKFKIDFEYFGYSR